MKHFIPKVMTTSCPLERHTNPRSFWRELLNGMKPGNWFEFPVQKRWAVLNAAQKYTRGRYSAYQHPEKEGIYIYVRIK